MRRRERALCFTAAAVPVLQLCPGLGWLPAVAGGACAALLLYICTRLLGPKGLSEAARWPAGRVASALLAAALAGLAVWSARQGEYAFPQTAGKPLPAVLLLILAWAAVRRGREVPARCAGVLLHLEHAEGAPRLRRTASAGSRSLPAVVGRAERRPGLSPCRRPCGGGDGCRHGRDPLPDACAGSVCLLEPVAERFRPRRGPPLRGPGLRRPADRQLRSQRSASERSPLHAGPSCAEQGETDQRACTPDPACACLSARRGPAPRMRRASDDRRRFLRPDPTRRRQKRGQKII